MVAGVTTQCYGDPPKGQKFIDTRKCGAALAEKQRENLTESRFGWMELVTTPKESTPYEFEIIVKSDDETFVLPSPELVPEYIESLKEQPYR